MAGRGRTATFAAFVLAVACGRSTKIVDGGGEREAHRAGSSNQGGRASGGTGGRANATGGKANATGGKANATGGRAGGTGGAEAGAGGEPDAAGAGGSDGDDPDDFITRWTVTGVDPTIRLPLTETGTYDFHVDWGDGTSNHFTSASDVETLHVYQLGGTYRVTISGTLEGFSFSSAFACPEPCGVQKLREIVQFGAVRFGNDTQYPFWACEDLIVSALDTP
ncbi:MAG TPA: hypothetical protein VF103_09615, partial [Polyangiaceae bacterium]